MIKTREDREEFVRNEMKYRKYVESCNGRQRPYHNELMKKGLLVPEQGEEKEKCNIDVLVTESCIEIVGNQTEELRKEINSCRKKFGLEKEEGKRYPVLYLKGNCEIACSCYRRFFEKDKYKIISIVKGFVTILDDAWDKDVEYSFFPEFQNEISIIMER